MSTTAMTIFEPHNVATIAQMAPQAYNENTTSHDRCLQFGQQLLDRVNTEGMSDALDQEIATFIERAKKTVKKMNGKRSAVTQLFDSIRSAYTLLENDIDLGKKGTIPAQLQEHRNIYAAKKREQYEAEQRRKQMEQAKANARGKYAVDVENYLQMACNEHLALETNRLMQLDQSITLDNIDEVARQLKGADTSEENYRNWFDSLRPFVAPSTLLTPEEIQDIESKVKGQMLKQQSDLYRFQVAACRDDILDRLPSKRAELKRMAQASAEEAERIRRQIQEREAKEAEQREKERAEREAKEKAAAELAAKRQQMDSLFGAAELQQQQYQPKTSVKKRIVVNHPEGFLEVVSLWWSQIGSTLTMPELEKIFAKQITYCNKLANDKQHPVLIQSEHIRYEDDVKAK